MIKINEKEKELDLEERFRYINMEEYKNKNLNFMNNVDTIENQYHSSNENAQFSSSRISNESKNKLSFALPNITLDEK